MEAAYPSQPQGPNWWDQRPVQQLPSNPNPSQPIIPATLLIRNLPEAIPHDTLSRLFSHYGASSARPCTAGRLKNCAFVDFKDERAAWQAQRQLNGLRFLGKVLSVEKASHPKGSFGQLVPDGEMERMISSVKDDNKSREHQRGPNSGCFPAAEPIAEKLGVDYSFPPHLEYAYPPPDGNILTNIVNALIAVPRFYTQVLHLMNKMNIPAPFRMALPTPPLPVAAPAPPPPPPVPPSIPEMPHSANFPNDESEMDTSDEEAYAGTEPKTKRAKREDIVGPAIDKDVAHEAVGLKPAVLVPKEKPIIRKKNPVLQINIVPKHVQQEDATASNKNEPQKEEAVLEDKAYATPEEIEARKLPPEEILSLPMFKNYAAGNPTTVIYIKNLAKDVVPGDFYHIFGSVFRNIDAAKSGLSVKLMKEGRMRGQAFVTFPSVELAHRALNLANGYVFKGKPMIIQFGRNSAAAKRD